MPVGTCVKSRGALDLFVGFNADLSVLGSYAQAFRAQRCTLTRTSATWAIPTLTVRYGPTRVPQWAALGGSPSCPQLPVCARFAARSRVTASHRSPLPRAVFMLLAFPLSLPQPTRHHVWQVLLQGQGGRR